MKNKDLSWYRNILLTGKSWSGKTTLLKELISWIEKKEWILTEEILDESWGRIWFEIADSSWEKYLFTSKQKQSDILFANKHRIHPEWAISLMNKFSYEQDDLLYLDEIGPLELQVPWFESFSNRLLNAPNFLLWTIRLDDEMYPYIQEVKKRDDVLVINISDDEFDKATLVELITSEWIL